MRSRTMGLIVGINMVLAILTLAKEGLTQVPPYGVQIGGALAETCADINCTVDPPSGSLTTGLLQQPTLSESLTASSTGTANTSPPSSLSANAQYTADIALGTLRAFASATASSTGDANVAFAAARGSAGWQDTFTITSGGQFLVSISLSSTISANGLPPGPCRIGNRAVLSLSGPVSLFISDDLCFPPAARTVTASFNATTGQVISIQQTLLITIMRNLTPPNGSASVVIDASQTGGIFKLDPITAGATYTTASGSSYLSSIPNQAPVANAGTNQSVHIGQLVTLDGSGSTDPDNHTPLTYAWSFVSKPAGSTAILSNPDTSLASFTPDVVGDYDVQLVVTDSLGKSSVPAMVTVSTGNSAPIADAGPDQAITSIGTTVQLDGHTSYDPDGDSFTYLWSLSQVPTDSTATLSNPSISNPTFVADKNGTYFATLLVTDTWGAMSTSDSVMISFDNLAPVAHAGVNQSVTLGQVVHMDGSASSDANGDALTYLWDIVSAPENSSAALVGATTSTPSFTADAAGTFVIGLVVNDGFLNSEPSTMTVAVTTKQSQAITAVGQVMTAINGLSDNSFKNPNMRNALTNKLNAVLGDLDQELYQDALNKLENDLLGKTNGCSTAGLPDKDDWITDCDSQNVVMSALQAAISSLY